MHATGGRLTGVDTADQRTNLLCRVQSKDQDNPGPLAHRLRHRPELSNLTVSLLPFRRCFEGIQALLIAQPAPKVASMPAERLRQLLLFDSRRCKLAAVAGVRLGPFRTGREDLTTFVQHLLAAFVAMPMVFGDVLPMVTY